MICEIIALNLIIPLVKKDCNNKRKINENKELNNYETMSEFSDNDNNIDTSYYKDYLGIEQFSPIICNIMDLYNKTDYFQTQRLNKTNAML